MKKVFMLLLCTIFSALSCYSQGKNIWANDGVPQYIYVGSLKKDKNSGSNREKIKVEVFGGDYGSLYSGTTTYGIGTRHYYLINKQIEGGANPSARHILRVYENGNNFDFVIQTVSWAALIVKSWVLDNNPVAYEFTCTSYNPTGKNEVTDQFTQTIFMTSSHDGNICIGVENPKNKLEVLGTIRATEVKVETGWADFVFDKNYKLPSLSEVENHIATHNRLPEIPSEAEVKENGVNLGEMQVKLLQKIEELTLYIIEQDKKITQQQKQIDELSKK